MKNVGMAMHLGFLSSDTDFAEVVLFARVVDLPTSAHAVYSAQVQPDLRKASARSLASSAYKEQPDLDHSKRPFVEFPFGS